MRPIEKFGALVSALVVVAAFALLITAVPQQAFANFTGAIFTTTENGNTVDGNIYLAKCGEEGVWINGGPQQNNPGLPPDYYVFQVTDPSGKWLLSTDPAANRQVHVGPNGRFDALNGGTHAKNELSDPTRIVVELCPFLDTPNPGLEYKAWLTPVSAFTLAGGSLTCNPSDLDPTIAADCQVSNLAAFTNDNSKTDNFKAPPGELPLPLPGSLAGKKFYDANLNQTLDTSPDPLAGEPGIAQWRFQICNTGLPSSGGAVPYDTCVVLESSTLGIWGATALDLSTYTIEEIIPTGRASWVQTCPAGLSSCTPVPSLGGSSSCSVTSFASPPPSGTSGIPASTGFTCTLAGSPPAAAQLNFGNVCLGAGGGLTLGFWSNKNGQALFGDDDLALMVTLNLRNPNGSAFDPISYPAFRTWLLSANATNMAYMLSAQLAAMELNVFNGKVDGSAPVYAPGLNALGFISVNNLMVAANTELGLHGLVPSDSPYRAYQEALKNALDRANNNQNFVQAGPCTVVYGKGQPAVTPLE